MSTLLVVSPGGHLRELWVLAARMDLPRPLRWATAPSPQSESLLADEYLLPLPYTPSRSAVGTARALRLAGSILSDHDVDVVVSTGALPAVPFFMQARARRVPCHYVESAARTERPSMTGRLVSAIPGVRLYTQYETAEHGRWRYRGSVLDGYSSSRGSADPSGRAMRVVVTVGVEHFNFRRMLTKVASVLPANAEVHWQTGHTATSGLPIDAVPWVPSAELEKRMSEADVVISHSGVGSALTALTAGKCPVLLPRLSRFGEHVDDHQILIGEELARRHLAVTRQVDHLRIDDLWEAAQMQVRHVTPPPFSLIPQ